MVEIRKKLEKTEGGKLYCILETNKGPVLYNFCFVNLHRCKIS
jgi:hypothetical protein